MEIIAVFAAAAVTWVIGAIWYGVISGPWMKASGVTAEQARDMPKSIYLLSFLCFVVLMAFAQYVFYLADVQGVAEGLAMGAGIGAFFGVPWMCVNNMYTGRPLMLTVIDGAYAVAGVAAGGAVLGLF